MWSLGEEIWVGGECFFGAVQACFFGVQRQNMDILSLSLYIYIYLGPGTTTFFWSFQTNTVVLSCSYITHENIGRISFYTCLYGLHTACIRSWFEEYTVVLTKYGRGSIKIYGRFQKYTVVYDRIRFQKSTA